MTGLGEDCASPAGETVQNCDVVMGLGFPGSSPYHMGLVDAPAENQEKRRDVYVDV